MRFWAVLWAALAVGCNAGPPRVGGTRQPKPAVAAAPEAWAGVATLAVVPPDSWTTDLDLPYFNWFRAVIMAYLNEKGWAGVPLPVIHRSMTGWKFTLAGELGMFTPKELCEKWGCEAIVYWDIFEEGGEEVELAFSCVKVDGTILWASGARRFDPLYNVVSGTSLKHQHRKYSMAIGECLRDFPVKTP